MGRTLRIMPVGSRMPRMVLAAVSVFAMLVAPSEAAPPGISPEAAPPSFVYPSTKTPYATPLASPAQPVRSEQLEAIARQADQQVRHGFELAGRGAYFAARSEFITALRLVAQGLDAQERTSKHGKALPAGLTAMKESEDFLPRGAKLEADLDLPGLIGSHVTPALKDRDAAALTPLMAMKAYLTYAQQQLAVAAGHESAGSMALHALGKLHEELAGKKTTGLQAAGSKAVVFYQAALTVCPENVMSANDLGVLLAKNGNYPNARAWLEHGAALSCSPTLWNNLAVVYERLGQSDLAGRARQQILVAQANGKNRPANQASAASGNVRWVGTEAFGGQGLPAETAPATTAAGSAGPTQTTQRPAAPNQAAGASGVLTPWKRDSALAARELPKKPPLSTPARTVAGPAGPTQTTQRPATVNQATGASGVLTPWKRDPVSAPPAGATQPPQPPATVNQAPHAPEVLTPWQRDPATPIEKIPNTVWR
jgi:tetratricopeptide (TPR) repeat protein